jgi:hypothetical protein
MTATVGASVGATSTLAGSEVMGRDGGIDTGFVTAADAGRELGFARVAVEVFCCEEGGRDIAFDDGLRDMAAEGGIVSQKWKGASGCGNQIYWKDTV